MIHLVQPISSSCLPVSTKVTTQPNWNITDTLHLDVAVGMTATVTFCFPPLHFFISLAVKLWKGPGGDGDTVADAAVGWHGGDGYVISPLSFDHSFVSPAVIQHCVLQTIWLESIWLRFL